MPACRVMAVALFLCGCGGCGSGSQRPHDGPPMMVEPDGRLQDAQGHDASVDAVPPLSPPWEDGLTPPGYAEPIWETVLPVTADHPDELYIDDAVTLPTGIVAVIPPDLFLIDETDGHIIAQGALPEESNDAGEPAEPLALVVRSSGDLAILAHFDGHRLIVLQYAKDDLSQQGEMIVLEENAPTGAMAEVNGKLVVLTGAYAGQSPPQKHLHTLNPPSDAVDTVVLPNITDQYGGAGFTSPQGEAILCVITQDDRDEQTYAEILRIDPEAATFEKMRISSRPTQSGQACYLFAAGDELMAMWISDAIHEGDLPHWMRISSDGTDVLADHRVPLFPLFRGMAYFDGQFAVLTGGSVNGYQLRTVEFPTGAVTGPYQLHLQAGEGPSDYQQALATDGEYLYSVIAPWRGSTPQHRIQKLAPLAE